MHNSEEGLHQNAAKSDFKSQNFYVTYKNIVV